MRTNQKGFSAVEGLLVLVIVVVIGLVGWFVYQRQLATKDKPSQQASKNQTIAEIVASIKEKISQEVPAVEVIELSGFGDVSYKVAGYDFLSFVASKIHVNYVPKNPAEYKTEDQRASSRQQDEQTLSPAKDIILSVLQENGFKELANYPGRGLIALYEREADACVINIERGWVGISCATKEALAKAANEVKPFVEALRAAKAREPAETAFGPPQIGTGTTENDKYAIVSPRIPGSESAQHYFYQENGKWVYFTSAGLGIHCIDTATNPIAAKAFSKICNPSPSEWP